MLARDKNTPLQDEAAIVDEAITSRRSVRAFLPDPVDETTIREILEVAARAPSGTNMQPWRVYVVTGETKERHHPGRPRIQASALKRRSGTSTNTIPSSSSSPIYGRRRAVGYALYGHLGIGKRDVDQMRGSTTATSFLERGRVILDVASWAPSGTNMQPWRVYVTTGQTKERISRAILNSGLRAEKARGEYKYYPDKFFEPYYARRRAVGYALYGHLGIGKRDVDQMRAQHDRNFVFFDAPVGMIFTIDRRLNQGSWVDYGMFLQNIMVAARARGLHSCPQAAFAPYHQQIRPVLGIPDEEIVVCGMALGYEDTSAPENNLRTERAPLDEWVTFLD